MLLRRTLAYLVDSVIVGCLVLLFATLISDLAAVLFTVGSTVSSVVIELASPALYSLLESLLSPLAISPNDAAGYFVIWLSVSIPYHALAEGLLRKTPGKIFLRLYATKPGGQFDGMPGPAPAALREILRYLEIPTLVGPALILLSGLRPADLLTGVRIRSSYNESSSTRGVKGRSSLDRQRDAFDDVFDPSGARARRVSGEAGEDMVYEILYPKLANGYFLFNNLEHRSFGDIDCLILGPGGIFLVEIKSHRGHIGFDIVSHNFTRNGTPLERNPLEQLDRQYNHLHGTCTRYVKGADSALRSVVCFPRATGIDQLASINSAISIYGLSDAIDSLQPKLSEHTIRALAKRITKVYGRPPQSTQSPQINHSNEPLSNPHETPKR